MYIIFNFQFFCLFKLIKETSGQFKFKIFELIWLINLLLALDIELAHHGRPNI